MSSLIILSAIVTACLTLTPTMEPAAAAPRSAGNFLLPHALTGPFTSKSGKFSIAIPEDFPEPALEASDIPSDLGTIKLYMYTSVKEAEGVCLMGYSDITSITITDELKERMLQGAREGAIAKLNATLESEVNITLDGHPGRSIRFVCENEGLTMRGRMDYYMVDKRLYQIGFIEIGEGVLESDGVKEFFSSFKLTSSGKRSKRK